MIRMHRFLGTLLAVSSMWGIFTCWSMTDDDRIEARLTSSVVILILGHLFLEKAARLEDDEYCDENEVVLTMRGPHKIISKVSEGLKNGTADRVELETEK